LTEGGWRDRQGFTRPEAEKEARARALRERFSAVSRANEQSGKRGGLLLPAMIGVALGVIIFCVFFWR
jgi:hypothetical protein